MIKDNIWEKYQEITNRTNSQLGNIYTIAVQK